MRHTTVALVLAMGALVVLGGAPDDDGDGVPNEVDCRPNDGSLWAPPSESVDDLLLSRSGPVAQLGWSAPADIGGDPGTERYDTYGTNVPNAFGHKSGFCVELDDGGLTAVDDRALRPGQIAHYLVRIENDCGPGPIGTDPPPAEPRTLSFFVAENTNDSGPGSLREAIDRAVDGDAVCVNTSGIITLASQLEIDKNISVVGPGADLLAIESGQIDLGRESLISGMTVRGPGAGIFVFGDWPLAPTIASMTLTDLGRAVLITQNQNLTIVDSSITDSLVGIDTNFDPPGHLTLASSTISGNDIGLRAFNYWSATITDSTISRNGIGLELEECNVTITNTTISGNQVGVSVYYNSEDDLTITSSTIANNTIGIDAYYVSLNLQNTILDNTTNCVVEENLDLTSLGHNLSSDATCPGLTGPGDQVDADPLLGSLADNGGPTETHLPLSGSPVIDAGNCPDLSRDQRELSRPINDPDVPDVADGCDVGAVERQ